jgi:regulator of sigma E protease
MAEIFQFSAVTAIAFVFVIGLVIVIHELGHLYAGRMCGVHAEVFSFGFGPTLFAVRDRKGTIWRIAALPLGGYVKFLGDANAASAPDQEALAKLRAEIGPDADRCFHFKPVWQRAFITAAGPIANFILAIVIFTLLAMTIGASGHPPVVAGVQEGSPAEAAGFEPGDRVISIDGREIRFFNEITAELFYRPGEEVTFLVERRGRTVEIDVASRLRTVTDRYGGERQIAQVGLERTDEVIYVRYGPVEAVGAGMSQVWEVVAATGNYIGRVVTGRASPELLNGPIGIVTAAGQLANSSLEAGETTSESLRAVTLNLIGLAGILSIGLGLVNLLPIPILDGGHLVYYAYEAVARRPMSAKMQEIGFRVGLALVLGMMLVATWNDLNYARTVFF